ncbi:MAG: hypothetical protein ABI348_03605 [Nitrososphaera sp.]|jgi:plastocyanin|nr:hypothetical protein [uncultured Nitrososphaera sp.]
MHSAAPAIAGLAAGIVFLTLFSAWAANLPVHRVQSMAGQIVSIPEGASRQSGQFEPQTANIRAGNFIEWRNEEVFPTILLIEPACKPLLDSANITSFGVEKELKPGESFMCGFNDAGEYRAHTEPWPWMQGTIRVAP